MVILLLSFTSCSLFEKAKKPVVKKASEIAKELSVKHLGCSTGDAVYSDVDRKNLTNSFVHNYIVEYIVFIKAI